MEEKSKEEEKKKKKGPVLVFVAPSVASHTGWCHLTNGQLETEQQLEQLQPEEKQVQGLAERPGGLQITPAAGRLEKVTGWRRQRCRSVTLDFGEEAACDYYYPGNGAFSPVFTTSWVFPSLELPLRLQGDRNEAVSVSQPGRLLV